MDFVNAVRNGDPQELKRLIEEQTNEISAIPVVGGASLLHWAADVGSKECAELLLDARICTDVNVKDDGGTYSLDDAPD